MRIQSTNVQVLEHAKGPIRLLQSSVEVIARTSGATIEHTSVALMRRQLTPSVRIASIYFYANKISMREVFKKTGKNSLRELVRTEENKNGYSDLSVYTK